MNEQLLTISQVAKALNVKAHRITYALANGLVEDVRQIGGRRVFSAADVQRLAKHFGMSVTEMKATEHTE